MELGNQLSKIFKEMYQQMAENGYFPDQINLQDTRNSNGAPPFDLSEMAGQFAEFEELKKLVKKPKTSKEVKVDKAEKTDNMPILDKMMKNDLEKLHLYGLHKVEDKRGNGEPLNNINI